MHREQPCSYELSGRKPVLRMPDPKSKTMEHLVRYKPGNAEEFVLLVIYGDLETCSGASTLLAKMAWPFQPNVVLGGSLSAPTTQ